MDEAQKFLRGIERLSIRIGLKRRWSEAGLFIESDRPIQSEFLPSGFLRGFCSLPEQDLKSVLFSLERPFFLMTFSQGPLPSPGGHLLGSWNIWGCEAKDGPSQTIRVEGVPELESYRNLEPADPLQENFLDAYTELYLSFAPGEEAPKGKFRLTDLDGGEFLLSSAHPAREETWAAARETVARKGGKRVFLPAPVKEEAPGFQLSLRVNLYGF